jgi:molybdenum cofactor cytidylyltransferase
MAQPAAPTVFAVAILAAGRSTRMGSPKLLLAWRNTSVLGHLIETWKGLGASQVIPVCATDAPEVQAELDRLGIAAQARIMNPAPELGMWSSIQCAARWGGWSKDVSHFVLTLGDQPHVKRETLNALLEYAAASPDKICQPLQNGRRRHPVLLPQAIWNDLRSSAVADLKAFLQAHASKLAGFEAKDPGLDLDLDTPEDYKRARLQA